MAEAFRVARLDDLERVPVEGEGFTLSWLPVRSALGIGAFGTNAYVADEPGHHVVEPHTEAGSGHQELYFVARGRATFTLDGEKVDAPAGTYVFLEDPGVRREAIAEEPGTTVLSFGAPLGAAYEESEWEGRFMASAILRTDKARARALLEANLVRHPDSGGSHFELARLEALDGNPDAALAALAEAARLRPGVLDWAREDEDLAVLRDDPRFQALLEP